MTTPQTVAYQQQYYEQNRERIQKRQREYYQRTKTAFAARGAKWRSQNAERSKAYLREWGIRKYGLTSVAFAVMLAAQGHGCAICGGQALGGRRLAIDHDHATGRVRGLLCDPCNTSLGQMKDDPALLRAAAAYIELHQQKEAA